MKTKFLLLIALLIATTTFSQVPNYVPTTGLFGWYPFNGNTVDESGNLNHLKNSGATLTADRNGDTSRAYYFDSNSLMTSLDLTNSSDPLSYSLWFKNTDSNIARILDLHCGNSYYALTLNTTLNRISGYGFGTSIRKFNINSDWNHVVLTSNGQKLKFYYNGVCVDSANQTIGFDFGLLLTLGKDYRGILDDIGLWSRAITQSEVTMLYLACNDHITSQPTSIDVNAGNEVKFNVGYTSATAKYQWQTDLGSGFQNLTNSGQYSGTDNDTLIVANASSSNNNQKFRCLINSGFCHDTTDVVTLTVKPNGIDDLNKVNQLSVYPNPATNQITVRVMGSLYSITNQLGQTILSGKLTNEKTLIDISNLKNEIYFIKIDNGVVISFIKL